MNVTEKRLNDILEEVVKILEKQIFNLSDFKYITVSEDIDVFVVPSKPCLGNNYWQSYDATCRRVLDLRVVKLLLEISTDWKELCFKLPKPKKGWKSDVQDISNYYHQYGQNVIQVTCDSQETANILSNKLQAQQKIYDIIAKTQHEIEPDWVINPNDTRQYKYFLFFGFDDLIDWSYDLVITKDCRLYMSDATKNRLIENNLITPELWKQAFC